MILQRMLGRAHAARALLAALGALCCVHAGPAPLAINDGRVIDEDWASAKIDLPNDVNFYLYTSSNPVEPVEIYVDDLNGANFDASKCTKAMIHGFGSSGNTSWIKDMKDVFIRTEGCNVVAVDWQKLAANPFYDRARANTKPVGEYLAVLLDFLAQSTGAQLSDMHCLGHSLGAHVCGYNGKALDGQIGRVTGFDPALPLFNFDNVTERLASTDAIFVDVIHTCAGLLGYDLPIGQVDFYPNGGEHLQPGCGFDPTASCSHERSWVFFMESIESLAFRAVECGSWDDFVNGLCDANVNVPMGYFTPEGTTGTFYLATSGSPPYALG